MGTITLNIPDKAEQLFRKAVKETKGVGKGKLGKAATEALVQWAKKEQQQIIAKRLLQRMQQGFNFGGGPYYKSRDEIYEKRVAKQCKK